jgi:hypothetical protein
MIELGKGSLPWQLDSSHNSQDLDAIWSRAELGKKASPQFVIGEQLLQIGPDKIWWNGICRLLDYVRDNSRVDFSIV